MNLVLISLFVFGSVVTFCYVLGMKIQSKTNFERRLALAVGKVPGRHGDIEIKPDEQKKSGKGKIQLLLGKINEYLKLKPSRALTLELVRADIGLGPGEYLVLNIILGVTPLGLVFFGYPLVTALFIAGLAFIAPILYIKRRKRKRILKIEQQLPEILNTISNSLKAGYSFLQSMELVSLETEPPINSEFALVLKEMNLGATTERALENLVARVASEDMELVITAVLIQRQIGGNLSEILESIAYTIRERLRIKGEINTLTAQGRISGLIIAALPFALGLLMFLLNPGYIQPLFNEPLGQLMLGAGIAGQILAVIVISKIVNIRV